ncbi:MAG: hypothetical protein J6K03_02005 [Oscillospiraceae bacterium]|nr:hypothetical protein [Oscillospiraceae bacterium]
MSILDHMIHTAEAAEEFESFFKRTAKRLLVFALILGLLGAASIFFLVRDVFDGIYIPRSIWVYLFLLYIMVPSVGCLILSALCCAAAKYVYPKRYELPENKK